MLSDSASLRPLVLLCGQQSESLLPANIAPVLPASLSLFPCCCLQLQHCGFNSTTPLFGDLHQLMWTTSRLDPNPRGRILVSLSTSRLAYGPRLSSLGCFFPSSPPQAKWIQIHTKVHFRLPSTQSILKSGLVLFGTYCALVEVHGMSGVESSMSLCSISAFDASFSSDLQAILHTPLQPYHTFRTSWFEQHSKYMQEEIEALCNSIYHLAASGYCRVYKASFSSQQVRTVLHGGLYLEASSNFQKVYHRDHSFAFPAWYHYSSVFLHLGRLRLSYQSPSYYVLAGAATRYI